ncbi:MAG: TonB-dependent receptor [Balneolia bacterium]|nr:TonB-dependent receptor [Balneolia bacterium]
MPLHPVKQPIITYFATFVLLSLSAISSFANSDGSLNTTTADTLQVDLEEIRIEAARLTETSASAPFAASTVRISEPRRIAAPGLTLTEPLRGIPGVWVNDRNNFAVGERLSVRGMGWRAAFGVRGVNILMDGVPLTMPDGQAIMSLIDPAFIKDVEVIRGPVSGFWGNAGGGAILLSTANFRAEPFTRVRATAGSFGFNKQDLETGFNIGGNSYMLYGSRLYQDGFRDHSRFEAWRLGGNARINLDERSTLTLTGAFLESPISDNPGALTAEELADTPSAANPGSVNQNARKITRHGQFGAGYQLRFDNSELNVQSWGLARKLQNPLAFAWIQVDRLAGGFRSSYQQEMSDFTWGVGVDAAVQSDSRRNWANEGGDQGELRLDQQEDVYSLAGFSRISIPFGDFTVSGGLRFDWLDFRNNDRFMTNIDDTSGDRQFLALSPMVSLSYDFGNWLTFVNYSTGFETPTTTELVNRPDMTGGFNPDLDPERTNGFELGTRGRISSLNMTVDAAVFTMQVRDLLQQFQIEDDGRDYYQNVGSTRHSGFEVFVDWQIIPNLDLVASYGFSDFTFTSDELTQNNESLNGNRLPGIPQHRVNGAIQYRISDLLLRGEGEFSDEYFVNSINTAVNESYTVFNLNASWVDARPFNGVLVTPFVQVNNIFDASYAGSVVINGFGGRFYEPAPGRNFMAGINVTFNY